MVQNKHINDNELDNKNLTLQTPLNIFDSKKYNFFPIKFN